MLTYKGIEGTLIAEKSVEEAPVVMWTVLLSTGKVVIEPMHQFELHTVSILQEIVEKYRDAA